MNNSSVDCEPNSAITGNGVVIATIITALLTVSLTAAEVFGDSKVQIAPEIFPTTGGLPQWVCKAFLDTINGLGASQLVTSSSLILCTLVYYPQEDDPHAGFALALGTLASSGQVPALQVLIATETMYGSALLPRAVLGTIQALFLFIIYVKHFENSISPGLSTGYGVISAILLTTNISITLVSLMDCDILGNAKYLVVVPIVMGWLIILVTLSLVIYLKYGNYWPSCSLHTHEENEMTFGQLLAILMLGAVIVGLVESLIKHFQSKDEQDDSSVSGDDALTTDTPRSSWAMDEVGRRNSEEEYEAGLQQNERYRDI